MDLWSIKERNLFTRQKVGIINLMYMPKMAYRMNVIEYDRKSIDEINKICTNNVKDSMKWPRNSNNYKVWNNTENGGTELYNITMINQKIILGTFVKQCLNHESVYPKKLILEKLGEWNVKIEEIGKNTFDQSSSYIATVGRVMKKELNI